MTEVDMKVNSDLTTHPQYSVIPNPEKLEDVKTIEKQILESKLDLEKLTIEINKKKEELSRIEELSIVVKNDSENKSDSIEEYQKKIVKYDFDLYKVKEELKQKEMRIDEQTTKLHELEAKYSQLQLVYEHDKKANENLLEESNITNKKQEAIIKNFENKIKDYELKDEEYMKYLMIKQNKEKEESNLLDEINKLKKDHEKTIENLNLEVSGLKTDLERASQMEQSKTKEIEDLKTSLSKYPEIIKTLELKVNNSETEKSIQAKTIEELKLQNNELAVKYEKQYSSNKSIELKRRHVEGSIESLQEKLELIIKKQEETENENSILKQQTNEMIEQIDLKDNQLRKMSVTLDSINKVLRSKDEEISRKDSLNIKLAKELETKKSQNLTLNQKLKKINISVINDYNSKMQEKESEIKLMREMIKGSKIELKGKNTQLKRMSSMLQKVKKVSDARADFITQHSNKEDLEQTQKIDQINGLEKEIQEMPEIYEEDHPEDPQYEVVNENRNYSYSLKKKENKLSKSPQDHNNSFKEKYEERLDNYAEQILSSKIKNNSNSMRTILSQNYNAFLDKKNTNEEESGNVSISKDKTKLPYINIDVNEIILKSLRFNNEKKRQIIAGSLPNINTPNKKLYSKPPQYMINT